MIQTWTVVFDSGRTLCVRVTRELGRHWMAVAMPQTGSFRAAGNTAAEAVLHYADDPDNSDCIVAMHRVVGDE